MLTVTGQTCRAGRQARRDIFLGLRRQRRRIARFRSLISRKRRVAASLSARFSTITHFRHAFYAIIFYFVLIAACSAA